MTLFFVRVKGLEPPCREALDPKSSVSTNFTTPASLTDGKGIIFYEKKFFWQFYFYEIIEATNIR